MKRFHWFRSPRILWFVPIVFGIGLILAGVGYWYINRPQFYAFAQEKIRMETGADIRWKSLQWSLRGWLKIVDPQADYQKGDLSLHLSADSISLSRLFSGKADVEMNNATVGSASSTIGSVSRTEVRWTRGSSTPQAEIILEGVGFDYRNLPPIAADAHEKSPSSSLDLSWLRSVRVADIRFDIPSLQTRYIGNGTVHIDRGQRAEIELWATDEDESPDVYAEIQGSVNLSPWRIRSAELRMNYFPVSVAGVLSASMAAEGTINVIDNGTTDYQSQTDLAFSDGLVQLSGNKTLLIPHGNLFTQTVLSSRLIPMQATASVSYSTSNLCESGEAIATIPQGKWSLGYGQNPSGIHSTTLDGRMAGEYGSIALHGEMESDGSELGNYSIRASVQEGRAAIGAAQIERASLGVSIRGKGALGTLKAEGRASAAYPVSGTHTISLQPVLQADGNYDWGRKEYRIRVPQADLGLIHSVSGWLQTGNRWRFEGEIPLEESVKQARDHLPLWGKALEGMGNAHLTVNGAGKTLRAQVTSPDFMLYSMADDYTYGAQLRDLNVSGDSPYGKSHAFRVELSASTPYITYGANDYEWAGESIRLGYKAGEKGKVDFSMNPPGGGNVSATGVFGKEWKISVENASLESFVIPVFRRFVLSQSDDKPFPVSATGTLNAGLSYRMKGGEPFLAGLSSFSIRSLQVPGAARLSVRDATLTIPVFSPLSYEALASQIVSFSAARVSWDGAEYNDVSYTIPVGSNRLALASNLTLPLCGGEVTIRNLAIKDWLTNNWEIEGEILLSNLQLAKVSSLTPLAPAEGSVSGRIERIAYAGDRIELKGELIFSLFGGTVTVREVFLRNSIGGSKVAGFSADMERIDLQKLATYFQYGTITGVVSGRMRNVQVIAPPPGSKDLITPERLDIELYSDPKVEGVISRDTLFKIVELSGKTDMDLSRVKVTQFRYAKIGLHVVLDGVELRLIGTLDDNLFLAPSKALFVNKIGIRLASSDKTLNFLDFWSKLLAQTGRQP